MASRKPTLYDDTEKNLREWFYGLSATLYGHDNRGGYAISHRWI